MGCTHDCLQGHKCKCMKNKGTDDSVRTAISGVDLAILLLFLAGEVMFLCLLL